MIEAARLGDVLVQRASVMEVTMVVWRSRLEDNNRSNCRALGTGTLGGCNL